MESDDDWCGGEALTPTLCPAPAVPGVRQTPGHGDEVTHKLVKSVLPPPGRDLLFCLRIRVQNPVTMCIFTAESSCRNVDTYFTALPIAPYSFSVMLLWPNDLWCFSFFRTRGWFFSFWSTLCLMVLGLSKGLKAKNANFNFNFLTSGHVGKEWLFILLCIKEYIHWKFF